MTSEIKRCPACSKREGRDVLKPMTEFGQNKRSPDGLMRLCLACYNEYQREVRERNKVSPDCFGMSIPARPDKVFSGKPGRVIARIAVEGSGW